ncbi:hypothetical protein NMG60_11023463 [Bertholletia excelsa]
MGDSFKKSRLMVLIMIMALQIVASGGTRDEDCRDDLESITYECWESLQAGALVEPSEECCDFVKGFDAVCACRELDPNDDDFLPGEKLAYVAQDCGKHLPPGTQCGSKYNVHPHY